MTRIVISSVLCGIIITLSLWMAQETPSAAKNSSGQWFKKAYPEKKTIAILLEMGIQDAKLTDYSGKAIIQGAKVVHREGYRFIKNPLKKKSFPDELIEPDRWRASSHRAFKMPPSSPALNKLEKIATVGVVFHLQDVQANASIEVQFDSHEPKSEKLDIAPILQGKTITLANGDARLQLISTATPVETNRATENDYPAAAYAPDGSLWVAYISYAIQDENRRQSQQMLKEQPTDFRRFYQPGFYDQLKIRRYAQGKWSEAVAVTDANQDLCRCAIAVGNNGAVQVVYSTHRGDRYIVAHRELIWDNSVGEDTKEENSKNIGKIKIGEERLSKESSFRELTPQIVWNQDNQFYIASRIMDDRDHLFQLGIRQAKFGSPENKKDKELSQVAVKGFPSTFGQGHIWSTAICTDNKNRTWVAFDNYREGDYDICLWDSESDTVQMVAGSSRKEARPSIACDHQGRIWIAYEEGPELWGKDYGALDGNDGQPLYSQHSVKVVCLIPNPNRKKGVANDQWMEPVASLPNSNSKAPNALEEGGAWPKFEHSNRYSYPQIGVDGEGNIWLISREKFGSRYSTTPGSYWLSFAQRLEGKNWSGPIELNHSDGLLDHRPVILPDINGGIRVLHNSDGRYNTPENIHNQIWQSVINLAAPGVAPELKPMGMRNKDAKLLQRAEKEWQSSNAIRDYRLQHEGKTYQLLRGDFHRHSEISWDGGSDGSLEDMFRYAMDASRMDWLGNGDHDNGAGREYAWWLVQKMTDSTSAPGGFQGIYCYERSNSYPHGHRNCLFVKRGVLPLPRLAQSDPKQRVAGIHADDTKMLYRYLKETGGICASHTSATGMGTDWRDNDPDVEPLVEIYQGDRMSYEMQGAPRTGNAPKSGKLPVNIAGWYPAGYVDLALGQKGYKLGFEASSDHWSTHISFGVALSESKDRAAIIQAMKKRHTYAATDDIICDVRCGKAIMGDILETAQAPQFQLKIIGTSTIKDITVLRDSKPVATIPVDAKSYEGNWSEKILQDGEHYYYFRVMQKDDELAWTSPIWIKKKN